MGIITPKLRLPAKLVSSLKLNLVSTSLFLLILSGLMSFSHSANSEAAFAEPVETRSVWNTNSCYDAPDYALWLRLDGVNKHFKSTEGTFIEFDDGTAELNMLVRNTEDDNKRFEVSAFFDGRTFNAPADSPKPSGCADVSTNEWYYYTSTSGTLKGTNSYAGALLTFERFGAAFQLGQGANITDISGNFGASGWLDVQIERQPNNGSIHFEQTGNGNEGDFNIQLSGNPLPPCLNVTDGGTIQGDDLVCAAANDPGVIQSITAPSGGAGALEYLWLSSTNGCPESLSQAINGATSATYNPGPINQTTWYVRCSRRAGCSSWDFGESNCVKIEFEDTCGEPAPTGWTLTCEDGQSVEIIGKGIRCENDYTINIPDAGNVVQVIAEVVYKGTNANPNQLTIKTNNETAVVAAEFTDPARAYFFRTTFGAASSVTLDHIPNACQAQSLLLYVFRDGGQTTASTGRFVSKWIYQGTHCEILEIPTAPAIRDVEITVPLSEITTDGRVAIVRAEVVDNPSIFAEVIINDINQGDALHIATLTLAGVAPLENEIEICVESPLASSPYGAGQSLVYAGGIKANPDCKTCDDSDLGASAEVISDYNGAQISCVGADDGRLQALVSGGVPPFVYTWSNGMEGQIISDVAPGTYTVTITDQFGCEAVAAAISIEEPEALVATIEITSDFNGSPISCNGSSDAAIRAVATGGTGSYTYQWGANGNFSNNQELINLGAGTYEVLISDENGCTSTANITLEAPEDFIGDVEIISNNNNGFDISCAGAADGSVSVNVEGGTPPYIYNWSNGGTTASLSDLGPGTFTVTITDQNGCEIIRSTTLVEPNPLTLDVAITSFYNGYNISCFGENDGSASSLAAGGVGILTYNWSNGASTANIDELTAGTYSLTVTDENECTIEGEVTLTEPSLLVIEAQVISDYAGSDISCAGADDGRAQILISGSVAPYSINWSNGENTQIISDLSPGQYEVTVTDANGCEKVTDLTIEEPTTISCEAQITSNYFEGVAISTIGGNDGSASVSATGGTGNISYLWSDTNGQTTTEATGLIAGDYTVIVSDENGCTCSSEVTLENPAKVGNTIFADNNGNGVFDLGDIGVPNVSLTLTGTSNSGITVTRTITTDGNGNYDFDGLLPGDYKITIDVPTGFNLTYLNIGGNEALDSDFDPTTNMTEIFSLAAGEYNDRVDGGIFAAGKIGDTAWIDCDKNGKQDSGEDALANVGVTLSGTNGLGENVNLNTTTGADGKYEFINLAPGNYKLTFELPDDPTGLGFTGLNQIADGTLDSDVDPQTGMTAFFELKSGAINEDLDAGFQDIEAPVLFGVPQNANVSCDEVPTAPTLYADITATDNLDENVEIIFTETSTQGNGDLCTNYTYQIIRTWLAKDDCGNESTRTQIINVTDDLAPELTGVPANLTLDCAAVPDPANPTATDNCDDDLQIQFTEQRIDGTCLNDYTLIRTWTVVDDCGNSYFETQEIIVEDNETPIFSGIPADLSVSCDEVPAEATPEVTDNCSLGLTIDFQERTEPGDCLNSYIIFRTWTATDECGNQTVEEQKITVSDDEAPELISVPNDLILSCEEFNILPDAIVTVTDNCTDNLVVNFVEELTEQSCANTFVMVRTWSATDECGNTTTEKQTITVRDDAAPVLSGIPADLTLSCESYAGYNNPLVTVEDNCTDNINIDFVEEILEQSCTNAFVLKLTWTAVDDCGNTTTETQTITVNDDESPVLSGVPTDVTLSCEEYAGYNEPFVSVTDNCSVGIEIETIEELISQECENTFVLQLTWSATDECGNTTTEKQTITVSDDVAPVLSGVPADVTLSCQEYAGYNTPTVTVEDNCTDGLTVDFIKEVISQECENTFILKLTWSAADACGNTITETQTITVSDEAAPELSGVPADITLSCEDYSGYLNPVVTASDNCTDNIEVDFIEEIKEQSCPSTFVLELTWTAVDACGNSASETQTITVSDETAPILSGVPADATYSCEDYAGYVQPVVTATDDCTSDIEVTVVEEILGQSCANIFVLQLTWTAVDECGNSTSETQRITVIDDEAPVLSGIPANVTLSCEDYADYQAPNVTVTDNCSANVEINLVEEFISQECENTFTLKLTWSAADECGNTTTETQLITVEDNAAPELSGVPANVEVDCDEIPAAPTTITATDNCTANITVEFLEQLIEGSCANEYVLKRTWTATDECGNSSSETQEIFVSDKVDPELFGVPADMNVNCDGATIDIPNVTAIDNCSEDLSVVFSEVIIPGNCDNSYNIVRTWTVTDECGNSVSEKQTIEVGDDTAPVLEAAPADLTVDCNDIPLAATLTATDDCGGTFDAVFVETFEAGNCEHSFVIKRTWTATDDCGNTTFESQEITVEDNEAPEIIGVPASSTLACGNDDVITLPNVTVEDNCDQNADLSMEETLAPGNCPNTYTLTRVWTAVDACGNENTATQVVTIEDNTDPILSGIPNDVEVTCGQVPAVAQVTAFDDCQGAIDVLFIETNEVGDCVGNYIITRRWTATDACGNQASETQTITVSDTEAPVLSDLPANVTINIGNGEVVPDAAVLTAEDECEGAVTVVFEENESPAGNCGKTIYRTWTAADNCNNEVSHTQELTILDELNAALEPSQANACAGEIVDFEVIISGSGYTFDWAVTDGNIVPNNATATFSANEPGTYTIQVVISDENGCEATLKSQIIVSNPIVANVTSNSPICGGDDLVLSATGGNIYSWTGPNNFSSTEANPTITATTSSDAGTYTVEISNGSCTITETVDVEIGAPLTVDYSVFQADCGELGSINVGAVGGNGTITFDWADLPGNDNPGNRTDLAPGQYEVTVSDEFGCTKVLSDLTLEDNCDCEAFAGTLTPENASVCIENGSAQLIANPVGDAIIPAGYEVIYVLTSGPELVITRANATPEFTVNQTGEYTIHTLVYDPNTLDLSIIQFGFTTGFEVNELLTQGGGSICGSLDVEGITILAVRPFAEVVSQQDEYCDEENGQVTLAPADYDFAWSDGGTGAIRTDLKDGFYLVIATSPEGCEIKLNIQVQETCTCVAPLISDVVVFEAHCGNSDGSAEVIPAGNVADYSYAWSTAEGVPNGLGNLRTGVSPGIYTVTVTDNNFANCYTVVSLSIGTVDGPQLESIEKDPASCSAADGSITLLPATHSYIWTHDNVAGNSRNDLAAGTYQVLVIDANTPPCANVITVEVEAENNLLLTQTIINKPSCGENNGSIEISAENGSGAYEFLWDDGVAQNDGLRNELGEGAFMVTVNDLETGCQGEIAFALDTDVARAEIEIVNITAETCVGMADGAVDFNILTTTNFAQPAQEFVKDINGNIVSKSDLSPGTYFILVEDANGCLAGSAAFVIEAAKEIRVDVGVLDARCTNDGEIKIEVLGGYPDYTFDWADLAGQDNVQNRTELSADTYHLTIRDAKGCAIDIFDIKLRNICSQVCTPPAIANVVVIESNCNEANGSITVEMVEDNIDFKYTIEPELGTANGNVFTELPAGAYEISIDNPDFPDCMTITTVIVENFDGPTAELINSSPSQCGQSNGTAVLAPFNYIYEWCNGVVDFNPSNLPAGTCMVTITDPSTGCSNVMAVEIPELNTLNAVAQINNMPDCGAENGAVTINVIGAISNYSYSWSDGGFGKNRDDLAEGTYTVSIVDLANGCSTELQFGLAAEVQGDVQIILSSTLPALTTCPASADGSIQFSLLPSADFQLPAATTIVDQDGDTVDNGELAAGSYCLMIADANGCLANTLCFEVESPIQIEVDIAVIAATCDAGGTITVEAMGGTPGYTFDWADIPGNDNDANRSDVAAGTYTLTVFDDNGCEALVQNLIVNDDCLPCGQPDATSIMLNTNSMDQYCFDLEDCFDPGQVSFILDDGSMTGSSNFGNWELDDNGCLIYHSEEEIGMDVDEVCIIASDGVNSDTTCISFSIIDIPLTTPMLDTLFVNTPQDETLQDCVDISELGGFVNGTSLNTQGVDDGSLQFIDNCFTYVPNPGVTGMFTDTATIILCNSMIPACDTTVIIFSIIPDATGCDPIFNQMDETVLATDCEVGVDYCLLGIDQNDFAELSLFDNGDLYTDDLTACGTGNSEILLAVGPHELIIIDNESGCQDTLNVQVNCDGCDDFYTGPAIFILDDCEAGAQLCLDFEIADLFDFTILDNGNAYDGNFNVCVIDTQYQYVAFQLGQPAAFTLEEWIANGDTFSIDLFTSPQQLADSMNVWDPMGDWEVFGFVIVGGNGTGNYGPLVISANGIPTFEVPNQIIPDATTITLGEGIHNVSITNNVDGCVQNFNVNVGCTMPPVVVDTVLTVFEGTLDTFCFDLPVVNTITNLCPGNSDGNTAIALLPGTNCIEITPQQFGADEYCLVACETATGICDTLNIEIQVVPVLDTIFETINLGFTDTLCLDTAFFQNPINAFFNDCENPANTNVDFDVDTDNICVNYTGDLLGVDTACLVICDELGFCDTTIFIVNVVIPTPDTLILPILVGETDTVCLDISELAGDVETIINICPGTVGENASIQVDPISNCIFYTGLTVGLDTACMVICDEQMICDTTYLIFDVFNNLLPIAIDDDTTTTIGNSVVIEALLNDTINGNLEGFEIVGFPQHGNVIINPDGTITYTPNENFCGGLDSFMYAITNEFGSDTATVTINILCQELIIFSGFSPNGDDTNDVFTILGIENFPGNEVCIFNRWGNQVHRERGYRNEQGWGGTWDGKHLPDGTYFYVIDDGEGNTYSGYLQLHR